LVALKAGPAARAVVQPGSASKTAPAVIAKVAVVISARYLDAVASRSDGPGRTLQAIVGTFASLACVVSPARQALVVAGIESVTAVESRAERGVVAGQTARDAPDVADKILVEAESDGARDARVRVHALTAVRWAAVALVVIQVPPHETIRRALGIAKLHGQIASGAASSARVLGARVVVQQYVIVVALHAVIGRVADLAIGHTALRALILGIDVIARPAQKADLVVVAQCAKVAVFEGALFTAAVRSVVPAVAAVVERARDAVRAPVAALNAPSTLVGGGHVVPLAASLANTVVVAACAPLVAAAARPVLVAMPASRTRVALIVGATCAVVAALSALRQPRVQRSGHRRQARGAFERSVTSPAPNAARAALAVNHSVPAHALDADVIRALDAVLVRAAVAAVVAQVVAQAADAALRRRADLAVRRARAARVRGSQVVARKADAARVATDAVVAVRAAAAATTAVEVVPLV